ncbi:hypothetical protein BN1708_016580, partial [Verticillium longisporum]
MIRRPRLEILDLNLGLEPGLARIVLEAVLAKGVAVRQQQEVLERRRRETINEGINELAKIVPNCEKNKGSILQRAVTFINLLKENESQNLEKWTLEKLLTEQAIAELSTSNDKLKQECERLYKELETWKRVAQNAGLSLPQQNKDEAPAAI